LANRPEIIVKNKKDKPLLLLLLLLLLLPEGVCCSNYEGMLPRLNISTLYSRRRHLDALFLMKVFKNKISCSSTFDSVSIRISTRIIGDYSVFVVNYNFKVSPAARCVSAANDI
jgi:hypothetical protein